mmetsp:Transcript_90615/g.272146  ORF Transcript_90615/g.272146 Transcript_90615/m.272146 type:complete len:296 (-) Transcript_90615:187-1074(-)
MTALAHELAIPLAQGGGPGSAVGEPGQCGRPTASTRREVRVASAHDRQRRQAGALPHSEHHELVPGLARVVLVVLEDLHAVQLRHIEPRKVERRWRRVRRRRPILLEPPRHRSGEPPRGDAVPSEDERAPYIDGHSRARCHIEPSGPKLPAGVAHACSVAPRLPRRLRAVRDFDPAVAWNGVGDAQRGQARQPDGIFRVDAADVHRREEGLEWQQCIPLAYANTREHRERGVRQEREPDQPKTDGGDETCSAVERHAVLALKRVVLPEGPARCWQWAVDAELQPRPRLKLAGNLA